MKSNLQFLIFGLMLFVVLAPAHAGAVCPDTFQNIPFLTKGDCSTETYVNALYQLAIALGAILVVLRLIWAGTQYMLSGLVTSKEKAKGEMKAAILGLIIILAAVTILNTINPQLTELKFLRSAKPTGVTSNSGGLNEYVTSLEDFGPGKAIQGNSSDCSFMGTCDSTKYQKQCESQNGTFSFVGGSAMSTGVTTYYCLK